MGPGKEATRAASRVRPCPEKLPLIGWREWVSLTDAGIPWMKVKVDTGARTSTLHALDIERFEHAGAPWVRFLVHPWQRSELDEVKFEVPVFDQRRVTSSTGHRQDRVVIRLDVMLGDVRLNPEVTLTRRDKLGFRMLLGREAIRGQFQVDPGRSYLHGRPPRAVRDRNRGITRR